ncbi:MAG: hypothetical protein ABL897_14900 [Hyphomicrobium sp.]
MEKFDFNEPAELYVAAGRGVSRRTMSYRRFASGAEAVRYAMEVVGTDKLWGTVIETDGARFSADDIRSLYRHSDFPLTRQTSRSDAA